MIRGHFRNCYGLKSFDLPEIDFQQCNSALIYAPNGVMKSSFSNVLSDISKGCKTCDRIFAQNVCNYDFEYRGEHYHYDVASDSAELSPVDKIYVIHTFLDTFEFTKESVGTLLADEPIRNAYNSFMAQFSGEIRKIGEKLKALTGLTKSKLKVNLIKDLGLPTTADWTDIIEKVQERMPTNRSYAFWDAWKYTDLFNDKTEALYENSEFEAHLSDYIDSLDSLLRDNPILNTQFTDRHAESLGKELKKNNLFAAQHTIHLKGDTTVIHSLEEWNTAVTAQIEKLYETPELKKPFENLKRLLTANADVLKLRDALVSNREIIPLLQNISELKIQAWLDCFLKLDAPFAAYYEKISQYTARIKALYTQAAVQSERWQAVVDEFNRRFRVPFKIQIENKANFLLKDEAPNLSFVYTKETTAQQTATLKKDDLMISLSTGEKRALYLLYILFNLERIRQQASAGGGQFLIVADDIADSFDYKNKYAIIEYLSDLKKTAGIDLLILTHNFDFYRTVKSRLDVKRRNCLIAQRNKEGIVSISEFKYQSDFFKNVIIADIKNGNMFDDAKKKLLFASIPFYRNLCEYGGKSTAYDNLTCFIHLKTSPLNTENLKISDLWNEVKPFLEDVPFSGTDENYYSALERIATQCTSDNSDEVFLDNKLVVALAVRLRAEKFMKHIILTNGSPCEDAKSNQTRKWFEKARTFLNAEQLTIMDEVNLITPENIHLNAFMFEPLIDISDWALKELYYKVLQLPV